jgi:hypothetical protein
LAVSTSSRWQTLSCSSRLALFANFAVKSSSQRRKDLIAKRAKTARSSVPQVFASVLGTLTWAWLEPKYEPCNRSECGNRNCSDSNLGASRFRSLLTSSSSFQFARLVASGKLRSGATVPAYPVFVARLQAVPFPITRSTQANSLRPRSEKIPPCALRSRVGVTSL